jgi:Tfp pilus assembly protein PilO
MAQQLEQMKARLSDQLDVPAFIKLVSNEAARVGLRVVGIKPGEPKPHSESFYTEHPFDLEFRSVYPQLLIYLNRLATMETIVRVDKFSVGSAGSPTAQFVELSGKIELKTYKYLLSTADEKANELGKSAAATPPGGAQPVAKPASGEVRSGR